MKKNAISFLMISGVLTIFFVVLGILFNPDVFYVLIINFIIAVIGLLYMQIFTVKISKEDIIIKKIFSKYNYKYDDLKEIVISGPDLLMSFYDKPKTSKYNNVKEYKLECNKNSMIILHNMLTNDELIKNLLKDYKGTIKLTSDTHANYIVKLKSLGAKDEMFI